MKQIELTKESKNLPIATEILKGYKKSNKRLFIIVVILLSIIVVETTYLMLRLDNLNTSIRTITKEVIQCD